MRFSHQTFPAKFMDGALMGSQDALDPRGTPTPVLTQPLPGRRRPPPFSALRSATLPSKHLNVSFELEEDSGETGLNGNLRVSQDLTLGLFDYIV